jgi:hypothetical protein
MPSISPPSELIRCDSLTSCLQALYNFLFALLIFLAFLNFLYGAFLYLLSGGGIYDKEKGKNKMRNSVIALLVAFIIPIILNMINPKIFSSELRIPKVKVTLPEYKFKPGYLPGTDIEADIDCSKQNVSCKIPEIPEKFNCLPAFLKSNDMSIYTDDIVNNFSLICNNESGGDKNKESNVDKCRDGKPFSIGLFQINMVATIFTLPDKTETECRPDLIFSNYQNNVYNCVVINEDLYNKCKKALKDPKLNIDLAKQKYAGAGFNPWSAWKCIQEKCKINKEQK